MQIRNTVALIAGANLGIGAALVRALLVNIKGVEMPKASPADVAAEVLKGIEENEEDIFPDSMSRRLCAHWATNHKAIERQFAAM
jgi:short-subunit dehydrogenase